jgi:hypothetical protein
MNGKTFAAERFSPNRKFPPIFFSNFLSNVFAKSKVPANFFQTFYQMFSRNRKFPPIFFREIESPPQFFPKYVGKLPQTIRAPFGVGAGFPNFS